MHCATLSAAVVCTVEALRFLQTRLSCDALHTDSERRRRRRRSVAQNSRPPCPTDSSATVHGSCFLTACGKNSSAARTLITVLLLLVRVASNLRSTDVSAVSPPKVEYLMSDIIQWTYLLVAIMCFETQNISIALKSRREIPQILYYKSTLYYLKSEIPQGSFKKMIHRVEFFLPNS